MKLGSLAILSACETAHSRVSREHGLPGLAYAFLRAGATSVVASLWRIPDIAAYLLMSKLYGLLFQGSASLSLREALTVAQRWLKGLDEDEVRSYGPQAHNPAWAALIEAEILRSKGFFFPFGDETKLPFRRMGASPDLSKPFSNPFYWAGFMVIGDWRKRKVA